MLKKFILLIVIVIVAILIYLFYKFKQDRNPETNQSIGTMIQASKSAIPILYKKYLPASIDLNYKKTNDVNSLKQSIIDLDRAISYWPTDSNKISELINFYTNDIISNSALNDSIYKDDFPHILVKYMIHSFDDSDTWLDAAQNCSRAILAGNTDPKTLNQKFTYYFAKIVLNQLDTNDAKLLATIKTYYQTSPPLYNGTDLFTLVLEMSKYSWFFTKIFSIPKKMIIDELLSTIVHPEIRKVDDTICGVGVENVVLVTEPTLPRLTWYGDVNIASFLYPRYVLQFRGAQSSDQINYNSEDRLLQILFRRTMMTHNNPGQELTGTIQFNHPLSTGSRYYNKNAWTKCNIYDASAIGVVISHVSYSSISIIDYTFTIPEGVIRIFLFSYIVMIDQRNKELTLCMYHGQPDKDIFVDFINGNAINSIINGNNVKIMCRDNGSNHITCFGYSNLFQKNNCTVTCNTTNSVTNIKINFMSGGDPYSYTEILNTTTMKDQTSYVGTIEQIN